MTPKMTLLTNQSVAEMEAVSQSPCLSLYQATHRHHPDNHHDPIRFRHLLQELEHSLRQNYPAAAAASLLEPFASLGDEHAMWNHTLGGLAVFGAPGWFRIFGLHRPVRDLAVVANSFHLKPLRQSLQTADRYQILALSRHEIKLFEGNRDALTVVDLAPGVPRTLDEALGAELTEPHSTVASYGGTGAGSMAMHHGHGGKSAMVEIDDERFFRAVDRAILEHHSRPSELPLLLAALGEHHSMFQRISHNPFLMADGLKINPDALSLDDLRQRAWQIVEPHCQASLAKWADEFALAKSKGLGLDNLAQVAEAAVAGRIATLLVEADRQIAGHIEATTGQIQFAKLDDPQVDDLLDDLGEMVVKMGGRVVVAAVDQMPTTTGAAAICRF